MLRVEKALQPANLDPHGFCPMTAVRLIVFRISLKKLEARSTYWTPSFPTLSIHHQPRGQDCRTWRCVSPRAHARRRRAKFRQISALAVPGAAGGRACPETGYTPRSPLPSHPRPPQTTLFPRPVDSPPKWCAQSERQRTEPVEISPAMAPRLHAALHAAVGTGSAGVRHRGP